MNEEDLRIKIQEDLMKIGLPVEEVDIVIRPYSKTLYGSYYPKDGDKKARVHIYPYMNAYNLMYSYTKNLGTAIHEMCHHLEFTSYGFVRLKGVMHSPRFWTLHNHYIERAEKKYLIKRRVVSDKSVKKYRTSTT